MKLDLKPEQAQVIDQAIEAGLIRSADDVVNVGLETLWGRLKAFAPPTSAEEWMRKFRAWAHSHSTTAPLLSGEAISREYIYSDRGL